MNPMEQEQSQEQVADQPAGDARVDAAIEKLQAAAGSNFDADQMQQLKAKLAKLNASEEKTTSGSESPEKTTGGQPGVDRPLTGSDVDWSEYRLDYNVAHLYPRAVYRNTPQGPAWVVQIVDFVSTAKDFRGTGKVNGPSGPKTEEQNLGRYLNDMVNGPEQWKISAVMPSGAQCGILLERERLLVLPMPERLKKSEEVEVPTDPLLQAVDDAAASFVAEQMGDPVDDTDESIFEETSEGLDTEPEVCDNTSAPITIRPVERGTPEHEAALASLDDTGALQARHGDGVLRALETAAPETVAAPTAGVVQPAAVEGVDIARTLANPEGKVAAAGFSAAQDLLRALNDPNFRASLPTEE